MRFAKIFKNEETGKFVLAVCSRSSLVYEDVVRLNTPAIGSAIALTPNIDSVDKIVEFDDESEALFALALHYEQELLHLKNFTQQSKETINGWQGSSPLSIFYKTRSSIKEKLGHYLTNV